MILYCVTVTPAKYYNIEIHFRLSIIIRIFAANNDHITFLPESIYVMSIHSRPGNLPEAGYNMGLLSRSPSQLTSLHDYLSGFPWPPYWLSDLLCLF